MFNFKAIGSSIGVRSFHRFHRFNAIALLSVLPLWGCSDFKDLFIVNSAVVPNNKMPIDGSIAPPPINLDIFVFREDLIEGAEYDNKGEGRPVYLQGKRPLAYTSAVDDKAQRNRLQDKIIERSNLICDVHKGHVLANSSFLNFATGFTSTVLSTVSAVVSGTAATVLSTGSASINALGTGARANLYQNLLASAILGKIDEMREQEKQGFWSNRDKEIAEYSVDQAIQDVNAYHMKCSFYEGIVALSKDVESKPKTRPEIDEEIAALRKENDETFKNINKLESDNPTRINGEITIRLNEARIFKLMVERDNALGKVAAKGGKAESTKGTGNGTPVSAPVAPVVPSPVRP